MANWRDIFKIGSDVYTNINLKLNTKYHFSVFTNRYNMTKHKVNVLPFLKNFVGKYGAKGYRLFIERPSESEFIVRSKLIFDKKTILALFEYGENGMFFNNDYMPDGYQNKISSQVYPVNKKIKYIYAELGVRSYSFGSASTISSSKSAILSLIADGVTYDFPIPTQLPRNAYRTLSAQKINLNKFIPSVTLRVNLGQYNFPDGYGGYSPKPFILGYFITNLYYVYEDESNMEGDVMVIGTLENR